MCGTPDYMAPEIILSKVKNYALRYTMFMLIAGVQPSGGLVGSGYSHL